MLQIYIAFLLSLKFLNVSNLAMTNYYIVVMEYRGSVGDGGGKPTQNIISMGLQSCFFPEK